MERKSKEFERVKKMNEDKGKRWMKMKKIKEEMKENEND